MHGRLDFGRHVEQRWPHYFLCNRLPDTWETGLRPACRAEVVVPCLAQESCSRHREDAKEDVEEEKKEDTRLKSYKLNREGGEKCINNRKLTQALLLLLLLELLLVLLPLFLIFLLQ